MLKTKTFSELQDKINTVEKEINDLDKAYAKGSLTERNYIEQKNKLNRQLEETKKKVNALNPAFTTLKKNIGDAA